MRLRPWQEAHAACTSSRPAPSGSATAAPRPRPPPAPRPAPGPWASMAHDVMRPAARPASSHRPTGVIASSGVERIFEYITRFRTKEHLLILTSTHVAGAFLAALAWALLGAVTGCQSAP